MLDGKAETGDPPSAGGRRGGSRDPDPVPLKGRATGPSPGGGRVGCQKSSSEARNGRVVEDR